MRATSVPGWILSGAALCAALAATTAARAQTTVTLPCVADNTLYESATGALSNARGIGLFVGKTGQPGLRRALVRFDVAAGVPAGARILDARLTVSVSRTAVPFDVDVFVHRALRAWGEGSSDAPGQEGTGAPATPGDATWLHSSYPNTFWTTAGGDFATAVSAVVTTPSLGAATSPTANGLAADVQSMLDNPAQNFGWLLKTDEALAFVTRRLESRESAGIRPSLSVTYLLPGQTAAWGSGCTVASQPFALAMNGAAIGGNTLQLVQSHGPANGVAVNALSLDLDRPGSPLLPQCSLYLPTQGPIVTNNLLLLDAAGAGSTPFAVPVGYPGVLITAQTAALLANGSGYVLSNAAAALLQ